MACFRDAKPTVSVSRNSCPAPDRPHRAGTHRGTSESASAGECRNGAQLPCGPREPVCVQSATNSRNEGVSRSRLRAVGPGAVPAKVVRRRLMPRPTNNHGRAALSLWLTAHLFPVVVERSLRFVSAGGFTFRVSATASLTGSSLRRRYRAVHRRMQFFLDLLGRQSS